MTYNYTHLCLLVVSGYIEEITTLNTQHTPIRHDTTAVTAYYAYLLIIITILSFPEYMWRNPGLGQKEKRRQRQGRRVRASNRRYENTSA